MAASTRIIIEMSRKNGPPSPTVYSQCAQLSVAEIVHWRSYQQACEEYVPAHTVIAEQFLSFCEMNSTDIFTSCDFHTPLITYECNS